MPGGAVVLDASGKVRLGIPDDSLAALVGNAPDVVRLAVAHLAEIGAAEAGLLTHEEAAEVSPDPISRVSNGDARRRERLDALILRHGAFLDADLLAAGLGARRLGLSALLLVESGPRAYVGPRLAPDSSPCVACVQRAVAPNRASERFVGPGRDIGSGPELSDDEARDLFCGYASSGSAEILEVDSRRRVVMRHPVRAFPDCPVCGTPGSPEPDRPPELRSRRKGAFDDTGARIHGPKQTFEAYRHLVSPLSGAVRHVRRVDVGSELIHVFSASHAMTAHVDSFSALMRDGRDPSGGKGSSADQARVSALCEALERFSAVSTGNEVDTVGALASIEGAIHPARCLLFSDRQYDGREQWNSGRRRFQHVPEPLDPEAEIAWSRVWCLETGETAHLPTAYLYFGFQGPGFRYCRADSNGLAAGRTMEEAILQGFLELVERDAIAVWWYNRLGMPEVEVGSFGDGYVDDVFDHYQELGRRAWVLDLTSDLGIPVFAAVSARMDEESPEVIFGFGAHVDPAIALRRCVTEMNQMLATVVRPPDRRRRQLEGAFDDALAWWDEARLIDNPYLLPDRGLGLRGRECFQYAWADDLLDDIQTCLGVARRHGLRTWVRDMSRADLGISVARVVVPGLRHFWRRLAPGRLYDVPVTTGRLDTSLRETDMNPISFFV